MLRILGRKLSTCSGIDRRSVLQVGALGLGGLTLPQILAHRAARAASGDSVRKTSVIFVELAGGPTQFETYDPKPTAPSDYRGPLGVVATASPGVYFSELMAEQARVFDKLAVVRSIHHDSSSHGTSSHYVQTGYYLRNRQNRDNEMPCVGAITSRVRGPNQPGLPAFVSLQSRMRYGLSAYLGKAFNPFVVSADPNRSSFRVDNLGLERSLTFDRLAGRRDLLDQLDRTRQVVDTRGVAVAMDKFVGEAFEMVTSGKAQKAFDVGAEPDSVRDRYGRHRTGQEMLLARRLIEAGVTFVTTRVSSWDDHNGIAARMKSKGPAYDQGLAALIEDLHERGMDRDVLVIAMGEFGRTPRVNRNAGRDHWGRLMSVLIAGGGLRMGQVVGSSNSKGETPEDAPYRPAHVLAMVYRHLGIEPSTTFPDLSGRPRYVLEDRELIRELV